MYGQIGYHSAIVHLVVEQHTKHPFDHVLIQAVVKVVQVLFVEVEMLYKIRLVLPLHLVRVSFSLYSNLYKIRSLVFL